MKEYTVTYTAEVTEVIKDEKEFGRVFVDDKECEREAKSKLDADDVHIRHRKVFEMDRGEV